MVVWQEIKTTKKSLREVLPRRGAAKVTTTPERVLPPVPPLPQLGARPRFWRRRPAVVALLLLFALGLGFALAQAFAKATVEITPVTLELTLDDSLTIPKSGAGLTFDVITLPAKTGTKLVKASGTETVSRKASGQIVIYNNYDKLAQKLVANTRFQSASGRIYRIKDAVTVPGLKTVAGKATPGTVEVTVYADVPGAEYNSDPTDFTIPGFKGDPRYTKFFARSKAAISGGLVGEVKKVVPAEADRARAELKATLTAELLKEARFKIPESAILFDGATRVSVTEASDILPGGNPDEALVKTTVALQGVLFPRQALQEKLIDTRVPNFSPSELNIVNFEKLAVSLDNPAALNLAEAPNITINVGGAVQLLPVINQVDLTAKLAGLGKSEAENLISKTKGVGKFNIVFRPIWLGHFPSDPSRIELKLPNP